MTSVLSTRVEWQKNHKTYAILNYLSEYKWNFTNIFSILNVLTNYVGICLLQMCLFISKKWIVLDMGSFWKTKYMGLF